MTKNIKNKWVLCSKNKQNQIKFKLIKKNQKKLK